MLPSSECLLYPSAAEGFSVIHQDEHDSLPLIMRLYADTFVLAAQLGFLATQLRQAKQSLPLADFNERTKEEVADLRQAFGQLWESPDVAFWYQHQDSLPRRSQEILQQVCLHFLSPNSSPVTSYSSY